MTRAWETVDAVETERGELELRQRGERDFLITIGGRVLMNSSANRSEIVLAEIACESLPGAARVLIGGLGMGYTLRAALDQLPADAEVVVAELHPAVAQWCRGPLAPLTQEAANDPRVRIELGDVAELISQSAQGPVAGRFDAIVLDLYEGPHGRADRRHPHYGDRALERSHNALRKGGVFAVWSEDPDAAFERRLRASGFEVERKRPGRGGRRHAVYLAKKR